MKAVVMSLSASANRLTRVKFLMVGTQATAKLRAASSLRNGFAVVAGDASQRVARMRAR
jgi:hypothetical protein